MRKISRFGAMALALALSVTIISPTTALAAKKVSTTQTLTKNVTDGISYSNSNFITTNKTVVGSFDSWSEMRDTFNTNLIRIYTMDILGQKWRGSGDKKLDNIIIDKYYYNRNVTWEEFETTLDAYYTALNSERNERKQVKNPIEPEKLLLNIIYSNIFTAADQNNESNYDIEHLATKNIMKEKICSYSEDFRLPISSVANLCLLPEYDNRTKREKILYDDPEYLSRVDINTVEEKFSFTKKSDFDWLNKSLSESKFREAYFNFLNNRFIKMKEKIKLSIFS